MTNINNGGVPTVSFESQVFSALAASDSGVDEGCYRVMISMLECLEGPTAARRVSMHVDATDGMFYISGAPIEEE